MKFRKIARFYTVFNTILQAGVVISGFAELTQPHDGGEGAADLHEVGAQKFPSRPQDIKTMIKVYG